MTIAFALIALFAFSLYGWGQAFRRAFHLESGSWPATAALGMSLVVFLGGVLNLLRLAYPAALATLLGIGIVVALPSCKRLLSEFRWRHAAAILLAAIVVGFVVKTQVPPQAYNLHDDYGKYFAHVVRMLETGTVYGNPLSAIGSQTLGGQAFLQGFLVAFFPISYINGFDSAFALFLCLMLASECAGGRSKLIAMALLCEAGVAIVNPQIVNVSAVYSGIALVMTLAAISGDARELRRDFPLPSPAAVGLLYAALIALKPTFALFVGLHLLFLMFAAGARWGARTGVFCAIFLSPWLLLSAPHYLAGLTASPAAAPVATHDPTTPLALFSFQELDFGGSMAGYLLLLGTVAAGAVISWHAAIRKDASAARMTALTCAAGIATCVIVVATGPLQFGYAHAVRYAIPFAIGIAPAAFGSAAIHFLDSKRLAPTVRLGLPLALAALPLLTFLPSLRQRVHQAATSGSVLAFSWLAEDPDYLAYNRQVLHGPARENVASMLALVPRGEPVIVWIDTPFYLDYTRNIVFDVESNGLTSAWSNMPSARYLIWQYDGYAAASEAVLLEQAHMEGALNRVVGTRTLDFLHRVTALAESGPVLYDNGEYKVVLIQSQHGEKQ